MATIVRLALENTPGDADPWVAIAARVVAWAQAHDLPLRDACLLVPFAQLLPLARRAFARIDGWMPRIETTKTLAASLGPAAPAQAGQLGFDPSADALSAAALLRSQPWGAAWARRDRRGFAQAAGALVDTAQALARAAHSKPPADRAAHWAAARELLGPSTGPGATERLLGRVALEWASLAPPPPTDRLFAGVAPAAWITVQAGGADPLIDRLMADATVPCLVIDTDAPADDPFADITLACAPNFAVRDGFEDEAQCTAAQVLEHVRRGELPVALIAQDRVLVRRVRALLEREPLRLLDETGWKLSTTRAAAQVMTLLRAARADATTDALFDWLKSGVAAGPAVDALEAACRRVGVARIDALDRVALAPSAAALWASASPVLNAFAARSRQALPAWLDALSDALTACGTMAALQDDDAGRQVIAALRLAGDRSSASAWRQAVADASMGHDEFRDWVDAVLEVASFLPTADFSESAQVVVTPLARALLRPFAAVVFPGADDKHLGVASAGGGLLGEAQAAALGLPTSAQRRAAESLAFVHALAAPRLTLLRRRVDGTDPLADSPLVERLALALAATGRSMPAWQDPRAERAFTPTPIRMSAPAAAALLPARLSASACEALRACPYRFFALNMLRLREPDELEREIEKRDYGNWLHRVLLAFHQQRGEPAVAEFEVERLMALATEGQSAAGLAGDDFLPFAASFATFAPRYIAWLHARDAEGAQWLRGEDEVSTRPEALAGTELYGIIDRVDAIRVGAAPVIELIDYKTGSAAALRDKVKQPLEDTQLAFYAALMGTRTELPLQAFYLALDGTRALEEVRHEEVEDSAVALVDGLAHDLKRLRAGAGLPALGVGATCDFCAARGLCRRDHWTDDAPPGATA